MKINLILFSLLAIPACAFAADDNELASNKPEGMLGVSTVNVFTNYYNDDASYYHENNYEEVGYGVGVNYNAFNYGNFGVDLGAKYYYVYPVSPKESYEDQRSVAGGATAFYKLGNFVPFYNVQVYHHTVTYQRTVESNRFGVECRFPDGWSITPSLVYACPLDTDAHNNVQWNLAINNWVTDRFNVGIGFGYGNYYHLNEFSYNLSFSYKFL